MARSKLSINRFDAGQVDGPNDRDISNEAAVKLQGLSPSNIGQLGPTGQMVKNASFPEFFAGATIYGLPGDAVGVHGYGIGLFQWVSNTPGLSKHFSSSINSDGMHSSSPNPAQTSDDGTAGGTNIDTPFPDNGFVGGTNSGMADMDNAILEKGTTVYTIYPAIVDKRSTGGLYRYGNTGNQWSSDNISVDTTSTYTNNSSAGAYGMGASDFEAYGLQFFLHEYSLDDNGVAMNKWVKLGNYSKYIGAQFGGTGLISDVTTNLMIDNIINTASVRDLWFNFSRHSMQYLANNNTALSLRHPWHSRAYTGTDVGLNKSPKHSMFREFPHQTASLAQYHAKYYMVNGTVRMYDANKEGITWFIGHCTRNLHNTEPSPDGATTNALRVNQWSVQPAAIITHNNFSSPDIDGGWIDALSNSMIGYYGAGAGASDNTWNMFPETTIAGTGYVGYYPQSAVYEATGTYNPFDAPDPTAFTSSATVTNGTYHPDPRNSGFMNIKTKFEPDDEGGFVEGNGPMMLHKTWTFSDDAATNEHKMESYPAGTWLRNYPGQDWSGATTITDSILKLSFFLTPPGMIDPSGICLFNNEAIGETHDSGTGSLSTSLFGPRMRGFKLYYSFPHSEDKEMYELIEWDMEYGWRESGKDGWSKNNMWHYITEVVVPPTFATFTDSNGYEPGTNTQCQYSTAAYVRNRTWVGNIFKDGQEQPGAMCKSPIGQPDIFPTSNIFYPAPYDGDEIVHIEPYRDSQLLIFKERACYVLNIEELDNEKIVNERKTAGLTNYRMICDTPYGKVWINPHGIWSYDGDEFVNLIKEESVYKLTLATTWQTDMNWDGNYLEGHADVEYDAVNDSLVILKNLKHGDAQAGDAFIYNFTTKSFSQVKNLTLNDTNTPNLSNLIRDYKDDIVALSLSTDSDTMWEDTTGDGGAGGAHSGTEVGYKTSLFQYYVASKSGGKDLAANDLEWITKDFTFDNLGAKKSIKSVLITYTNTNDSTGGDASWSNVKVQYSTDGDSSTKYDFSESKSKFSDKNGTEACYNLTSNYGLKETSGKWRTAKLIPNNKAEAKKINSFQLHFTNPGGIVDGNSVGFRIDDITIIYREHTTK